MVKQNEIQEQKGAMSRKRVDLQRFDMTGRPVYVCACVCAFFLGVGVVMFSNMTPSPPAMEHMA